MLHKAWNSKGEMPYRFPRSSVKFQGHTVQSITDFDPNWPFPDYRPVTAFKSLRFALLGFELTIFHHWFRWWLGTNPVTNHYLIQWWLVCWCIYASLSLHELNQWNPKSQFGNRNWKQNSLQKPNLHWYMKPCFIMFGHPMVIIIVTNKPHPHSYAADDDHITGSHILGSAIKLLS